MPRIRVIRELIYEGEEEWVNKTLKKSTIGSEFYTTNGTIKSTIKSTEKLEE